MNNEEMIRIHVLVFRKLVKLVHHMHRVSVPARQLVQESSKRQHGSELREESWFFRPGDRLSHLAFELVGGREPSVTTRKMGINFQSLFENLDGFVVAAREAEYETGEMRR